MISVSELYTAFVYYFDNPEFTKIKNLDIYSIYMCKLNVQLANEYRYLVAIVPRDAFFVGTAQELSKLHWSVFQTRSLNETHAIIKKRSSYQPKQDGIFQSVIHRTGISDKETTYKSDLLPIEISLLTNKNNLYDYPTEGLLNSALETYNTIIVLTK